MKQSADTILDRYRFYLANARGLAPNTVRAYAGDVGRFLDWLDGEDDDLLDMHPLLLGRWVAHLTQGRVKGVGRSSGTSAPSGVSTSS